MALSDTIEYKLGKLAGIHAAQEVISQYAKDVHIDLTTAKTTAQREDALAELGALREAERMVRLATIELMNSIHEGVTHATHK